MEAAAATYVMVWLIAGALLCGFVAAARGRSFVGWLLLGGLFGFFALLYLALAGQGRAGRKPCPGCAELIGEAATVCPHCSYRFAPQTLTRPDKVPAWPGIKRRVAAPCFDCDRMTSHDHLGTCLRCGRSNEWVRYWWGYRSDAPPPPAELAASRSS